MKKELATLARFTVQLEKLRGAVEEARSQGRARRNSGPPRGLKPAFAGEARGGPGFVEFSGAQLLDAPSGTVVELADSKGARLTMRLAAGQQLDVAAVVALFCGAQR